MVNLWRIFAVIAVALAPVFPVAALDVDPGAQLPDPYGLELGPPEAPPEIVIRAKVGRTAAVAEASRVDAGLSHEDFRHYRSAFAAAKVRRWKTAHRIAARAMNPLPAKILRWLHYSRPSPGVSFDELIRFVAENPTWPGRRQMIQNVEMAISRKTPKQKVLAWFKSHPATTGHGKLRLAEIMLADGRQEEGLKLLRDAWISGKFPSRQERAFRRHHRKVLTQADHARRLDRLLWDRQRSGARRMMRRVGKGQRALAQARLSLMEFAGGVDGAIRRVPDELKNHPGLIYERVRWRRRKNFPIRAAELLLPPEPPITDLGPRPKKWWAERLMIARRLLAKGHVSDAYIMACDHGQSDRGKIAEAEALAGWIALTQLKDANAALAHFRRLSGVVRYPVSVARGAYWSARAAEALGRKAIARAWYADAARHPTTYYGHLAVLALGEDTAPQLPAQASATAAQSADFQKRDLVHAVHLMTELNEREHVATFIRALASSETTPANFSLVVSLAEAVDRTDLAVAIAKRAAQIGVPLISANFPVVQVTGHQRLERALQLAVIRQESQFDARAVSHAGARGLMQLMPATARKVASRNRLRYSRRRLTSSPDYNATLGSAYLASLIKDYKGSYVLAIAAYNAGTPRVRRWIRNFGDPRKKEVDVIDWVESIPFTETRNYVQRVMEGLQVYRQRLAGNGGRMRLALLEDLNR